MTEVREHEVPGSTQQLDAVGVALEEMRQALRRGLSEGGTRSLLRLTDEELAVLGPPAAGPPIIAAPHLEGMTEQQREWVLATALRSLVSRELVEVTNVDELDATLERAGRKGGQDESAQVEVDLRFTKGLDQVLLLRRTADRLLTVERTTSGGTVRTYAYLHGSDLILIEHVTGGGLHFFTLTSSVAEAAEAIRDLVDPYAVTANGLDGPVLELDSGDIEAGVVGEPLAGVIEGALVVGELFLLADEPGPLLTTYATASQLWTVSVEAPHDSTGITARSVGQRTLTDGIARLLTFAPSTSAGSPG